MHHATRRVVVLGFQARVWIFSLGERPKVFSSSFFRGGGWCPLFFFVLPHSPFVLFPHAVSIRRHDVDRLLETQHRRVSKLPPESSSYFGSRRGSCLSASLSPFRPVLLFVTSSFLARGTRRNGRAFRFVSWRKRSSRCQ